MDLPGYGFAFAKQERVEAWQSLIPEYISTRPNLRRICLVVDARHGLKRSDLDFLRLLSQNPTNRKRILIALTKTDLMMQTDLARRFVLLHEHLKVERMTHLVLRVIMLSSKTGAGIKHLRQELASMMRGPPPNSNDET